MKGLLFVLAMMVVIVTGCNKSTKPTQKYILIGMWQVVAESFETPEKSIFMLEFGDDGVISMYVVENAELKLHDEKIKYTVDYDAKQFTVYKPSGEVDEVRNFEFISLDKLKTTGNKKENYFLKKIYLLRVK